MYTVTLYLSLLFSVLLRGDGTVLLSAAWPGCWGPTRRCLIHDGHVPEGAAAVLPGLLSSTTCCCASSATTEIPSWPWPPPSPAASRISFWTTCLFSPAAWESSARYSATGAGSCHRHPGHGAPLAEAGQGVSPDPHRASGQSRRHHPLPGLSLPAGPALLRHRDDRLQHHHPGPSGEYREWRPTEWSPTFSLVVTSIFTGIAQGVQPLISQCLRPERNGIWLG